jgi:ankyrin repeat protein
MTTKLILSKSISSAIITGLLITVLSCNNNKKSAEPTPEVAIETETTVKAPSTDLSTAVFFGNLEAVKQHIAAGTDLNVKDEYGSTPLHVATTFGKTDIAIALINGDADLTIKNNEGSSPLHIEAFYCISEIVNEL